MDLKPVWRDDMEYIKEKQRATDTEENLTYILEFQEEKKEGQK